VNKSKYADIQNEVLSKDNTSYRLCTFNVFLDICKKYHKSPVIEIKPKNISTSAIKSLLEEVNKYQLLAQSSFISFASKPLKLIKKIEPEALCFNLINARRYCFVQTIRNKILINHLIRKKCNISVHYSLATIKNIAKAHKNALLIGA
jgi:glycerophosphoryl diester phosphodiesterase